MKNSTTPNSAQSWITKTIEHHSASRDLFAVSHLHTARKITTSVCYVIKPVYFVVNQTGVCIGWTVTAVVEGLRCVRNRTDQVPEH